MAAMRARAESLFAHKAAVNRARPAYTEKSM